VFEHFDKRNAIIIGGISLLTLGITYRIYESSTYPRNPREFISSGQADQRIRAAKERLNKDPDDLDGLRSLALAYYQKGPDYYVDALNALEKAQRLGIVDNHLFYYAGVMYESIGLTSYAIPEYQRFLRHYPNDYEVSLRLANAYFRERKLDAAIGQYTHIVKFWASDSTALLNRAIAYGEKREWDKALNDFMVLERKVGVNFPPQAYYQRALVWKQKNELAEAEKDLRKELARSPQYLPALQLLHDLLVKKGSASEVKDLDTRIRSLAKR